MKRASTMIWLLCGMLPILGQAGCQHDLTNAEQRYLQEVRFRGAWNYAIGRLSYDEVVESWGPPTSVQSGYSPDGTALDDAPILANWHWSHSLPPATSISPEEANLAFGQRIELAFSRTSKLLLHWKYWEWGPNVLSLKDQ